MKKMIRKMINLIGYDVHKLKSKSDIVVDTDLYLKVYGNHSVKNKRFFNIGAGAFSHPCWTNIDYESDWYRAERSKTSKTILYDLFSLEPIPVESNSAEIIYSSHTVEHINDEAAQNMFNESFRMLKNKGIFRVTTPNINLVYRAYKANDRYFFYWLEAYSAPKEMKKAKYNKPLNKASIEQIFLIQFATSVSTLHSDGAPERIDDQELNRIFSEMEYDAALNYCTSKCPLEIQKKYPGDHLNWWNKDKMFRTLKKAGFNKIYLSGYGQSFSPALRNTIYFDNTHPKISLYVEAIK